MLKLRGTGTSEIPSIDLTTPLAVVDGGSGVSVTRQLAQIVTFQTGAYSSGTTITPLDNTIPQITEGDQYLSLAITPTNTGSTLEIDVEVNYTCSVSTNYITALFRDSGSNALASNISTNSAGTYWNNQKIKHIVSATSITATTFTVRIGAATSATIYFNGVSGAQSLGGSLASRITIKEYLP